MASLCSNPNQLSLAEGKSKSTVYQLYGLTEEVPSSARLSIYEKKEMSEEIKIVEGRE